MRRLESARPRMAWVVAAASASVLVTGCFGSSQQSRFYTLSTVASAGGPSPAAPAQTVRVAAVTLPESLERPQLVRRTGANTVAIEEFDRWVEPLDVLLRATLVSDLAALVPSAQVVGAAAPGLAADRTVVVAVNRLDTEGTAVVMDVLWFVVEKGEDQPGTTRRLVQREAAGSGAPGDVAAALSRLVEYVAREVATRLAEPPPSAAAPTGR